MKTDPLITVYTCNYNQSDYFLETIESVKNQTYKNIEYIFIDDASTDSSSHTLVNMHRPENMKLIFNHVRVGLPKNISRVFREAKGEFIIRIDSDDILTPNAVELLYAVFCQGREKLVGVYGDYISISKTGEILGRYLGSPILGAGILFDRKRVNFVGLDFTEIDCRDGFYITQRLAIFGFEVIYLPLPIFYYRKTYEGISADSGRMLSTMLHINRKNKDLDTALDMFH